MGAGASAAEGRVFCHRCGARTAYSSASGDALKCGACGATEEIEATDPRLPATSTAAPLAGGSFVGAVSSDAPPGGSASGNSRGSTVSSSRSSMRVESVSVVAVQRPEDGGLLLRVLPNLVARRDAAPADRPTATASIGALGALGNAGAGGNVGAAASEDWGEAPPEPASAALVSRLEAHPFKTEVGGGCDVCVICSEDLAEAGMPVAALSCGHTFHDACIRQWLTRRHTCPTCRLELEVDDVRYLRSIGLAEEADELEKVERERQAQEQEKQAAARQRWVDSMRRGDAVHFGLACAHCSISPLVGSCYRCEVCEGYMLCSDCYETRQAHLKERGTGAGCTSSSTSASTSAGSGDGVSSEAPGNGSDQDSAPEGWEDYHGHHDFTPFGTEFATLAESSAETGSGVPGAGGMLTVLVRPPARAAESDAAPSDVETAEAGDTASEAPGQAALAAAEVAFAAVRSLALAPLAGAPPLSSAGGSSAHGAGLSRWPMPGRQRGSR